MALSTGDRRLQTRLHAADHLLQCPTCAALAQPLTERRRGVVAWLLVPIAEAVRRAARSLRHNHVTQAVVAAAATAAVVFAVLDDRSAEPPAAGPQHLHLRPLCGRPPLSLPPVRRRPPRARRPSRRHPRRFRRPPACPPAAPLERTDPTTALGCPIAPAALIVTDVPADEGFWAETTSAQPIRVQLDGDGESPVDIVVGAAITVTGTLQPSTAAGSPSADPRAATMGYVLLVPFDAIAAG